MFKTWNPCIGDSLRRRAFVVITASARLIRSERSLKVKRALVAFVCRFSRYFVFQVLVKIKPNANFLVNFVLFLKNIVIFANYYEIERFESFRATNFTGFSSNVN